MALRALLNPHLTRGLPRVAAGNARQFATIVLTDLECIDQEDWFGKDDIRVNFNPDRSGTGTRHIRIRTGEQKSIGLTGDAESYFNVKLTELDDRDPDDNLGSKRVNVNDQSPVTFAGSGYHYKVHWEKK